MYTASDLNPALQIRGNLLDRAALATDLHASKIALRGVITQS